MSRNALLKNSELQFWPLPWRDFYFRLGPLVAIGTNFHCNWDHLFCNWDQLLGNWDQLFGNWDHLYRNWDQVFFIWDQHLWNWDQFFFFKDFLYLWTFIGTNIQLTSKKFGGSQLFLGQNYGVTHFPNWSPSRRRAVCECPPPLGAAVFLFPSHPELYFSSLMFMMALQCPKTFINFSGQIVHSIFSLYTEEAFVCCKHSHCRCRYTMYFFASARNIYDEVNFNCVKTNSFLFLLNCTKLP